MQNAKRHGRCGCGHRCVTTEHADFKAGGSGDDVGLPLPISRYPRIRDFNVYLAVRVADQTYCADYETVVLDEIDDLMSCAGKSTEDGKLAC